MELLPSDPSTFHYHYPEVKNENSLMPGGASSVGLLLKFTVCKFNYFHHSQKLERGLRNISEASGIFRRVAESFTEFEEYFRRFYRGEREMKNFRVTQEGAAKARRRREGTQKSRRSNSQRDGKPGD